MHTNIVRTILITFISTSLSSFALCDEEEPASLIFQAHEANKPIPIISDKYPEIDIQTAYLIQREYLFKRLVKDQIAGYKAGLTSENIQKTFGVKSPVFGVLFATGRRGKESIIDSSRFITPMIETEVGFIIGKAVAQPINDFSELYEHISAVVPVIEIPDLGFEENKKPRVIDIIASNVSAGEFIVGESKKINYTEVNNINVDLYMDGRKINSGKATDTMGDQWKALLWLVNTTLSNGWEIKPGQILITGVLGNMIPGKNGKYVADFGGIGNISFEVK